jgi:hypothetical protein
MDMRVMDVKRTLTTGHGLGIAEAKDKYLHKYGPEKRYCHLTMCTAEVTMLGPCLAVACAIFQALENVNYSTFRTFIV